VRKIKLLEVGQTVTKEDFSTYAAGILWGKISVSNAERVASPVETIFGAPWDPDLPSEPIDIGGVSVGGIIFSEVNSIAELYLQPSSFYYDFNNQILYIALNEYTNFIVNDSVAIGEIIGFISEAQLTEINGINYPLSAFLGSVFYEPRLNDISISESVDDQQNGIFVFDDLNASIDNSDGKFDSIRTDITGNTARLLIADISDSPEEEIATGFPFKLAADPEDFNVVRQGIVEDVDYSDPSSPAISAIDIRSDWTQTIAPDLLTTTEFAGLPDKFVNARKPFLIGAVDGAKCIPLRANGAAASFDYFITDIQYGDIQSVSQVYFKGEISGTKEDRFLTGGEYSVNLSTGIITINNVNKGDVWVYGIFTAMSETVEIILFLLNEFAGVAYIDSNFNKTEVEIVRDLDYSTHVNIDTSGLELFEVIQKLADDIKIDLFQQGSVLTMRAANTIRSVTEEIPQHEFVLNPPPWSNNRTDTIKSITVEYSHDYRTDLSLKYFDDSEQTTALDNNRKAIDQNFNTNLTVLSDVEEIYTEYYLRFINISRTVTIDRTIPFTAGLTDFISFSVIRKTLDSEKEIFTNAIYKIISINNIDNTCEAVFFEDLPPLPVPTGFVKITPDGFIKILPDGTEKIAIVNVI